MEMIIHSIEQQAGVWLFFCLVFLGVMLLLMAGMWINLRSFKKRFSLLMRGASGENMEKQMERHIQQVERHRHLAEGNSQEMEAIRKTLGHCIQYVGVKRYNAFDDVGSRLSYSIALLDEHLNGLVITGIYGRSESTTYAKGIQRGQSEQHLSVEEMDALQLAREQQKKRTES